MGNLHRMKKDEGAPDPPVEGSSSRQLVLARTRLVGAAFSPLLALAGLLRGVGLVGVGIRRRRNSRFGTRGSARWWRRLVIGWCRLRKGGRGESERESCHDREQDLFHATVSFSP